MNKLKKLRSDKKLTQRQLARLLGVSQQAIALYESGARRPRVSMVTPLANCLGVTVEDILSAIVSQN